MPPLGTAGRIESHGEREKRKVNDPENIMSPGIAFCNRSRY